MYHPPHRLGQLNYTCSTKSQIQNPKSRIQHPKSNIQNPKSESKIQNSCHPAAQIDARLVEIRSRCAELACIASRMQKSRIQNPESRIQNPDAGGRFRRIIPGSEMRRAQILSFTAAEASRILLGARSRILQQPNSARDLDGFEIADSESRIQNPSLFGDGRTLISLKNPKSTFPGPCARRECRAESLGLGPSRFRILRALEM